MNLITMIAVLVISLVFTIVFVVGLKSRGPWGSGWTFFTIVCLWLAAVSLWIPPAGPVWLGVPWIDLFVTGLLVSFVLSATSIEKSSSSTSSTQHLEETEQQRENPARMNKAVSAKSGGYANRPIEIQKGKKDTPATHHDSIQSSLTSTHSLLTYEPFEGATQALRAGGFFWMLLLCLCALIIIGAN